MILTATRNRRRRYAGRWRCRRGAEERMPADDALSGVGGCAVDMEVQRALQGIDDQPISLVTHPPAVLGELPSNLGLERIGSHYRSGTCDPAALLKRT